MQYSIKEAAQLIIDAGKKLTEEELVERTWGNISARISSDEFLITPSGRDYFSITEQDLVLVKIKNGSYSGNILPSSERFLHARCYALRPDCGFIIHTHQFYAGVLSIAEKDMVFSPCAKYAPPGTKRLAGAVSKSVKKNPQSKSFLMARHGALFLGDDEAEAFLLCAQTEQKSEELLCRTLKIEYPVADKGVFLSLAAQRTKLLRAYMDDFAQMIGISFDCSMGSKGVAEGDYPRAEAQILFKNASAFLYSEAMGAKPMSILDSRLQRKNYLNSYSGLINSNK